MRTSKNFGYTGLYIDINTLEIKNKNKIFY